MCDTVDNCPADPNADQADDDGDTLGNACDPCTNGSPALKPKLTISRLTTPGGDDTIKLTGQASFTYPFAPPLDPIANGVRLLVKDASGGSVLDVTIPGGAYNYAIQTGWKKNTAGTTWNYKNGLGGIQGITKATVKTIRSSPSVIAFVMSGKKGTYPVPANQLPVSATFVVDSPTAETGQCAELRFPGPAPAPSCKLNPNGSTLRCK